MARHNLARNLRIAGSETTREMFFQAWAMVYDLDIVQIWSLWDVIASLSFRRLLISSLTFAYYKAYTDTIVSSWVEYSRGLYDFYG